MDQGLIPRRYAKALYEVGDERNTNDALYSIMGRLADAFAAEPELSATIANPFVADDDKRRLLVDAVYGTPDGQIDSTYVDFIALLLKNRRIDMARDIANAFVGLYRDRHHIYRVEIESAAPLSDDVRKRLTGIIEKHVGHGTMEYDYKINTALIGGFRVKVGSERIDASVLSQLNNLRIGLVR